MPLTAVNFNVNTGWTTETEVSGFNPRIETDSNGFAAEATLENNATGFWNQLLAQEITLSPGDTMTVDCYAFDNLSGGAVTATGALGLAVFPTGGDVTITPGVSNPLNWFFNGASTATTAGIVAFEDGALFNSKPGSDTGTTAVNATTRNLLFTNGHGTDTVTAVVLVVTAGNDD